MNNLTKRKIGSTEILEIKGDPQGVWILLFHGFGADAYDLATIAHEVNIAGRKPNWIFPNGPLEIPFSPGWVGRAWFPINIQAIQKAVQEEDYNALSLAFPKEYAVARKVGEDLIAALNIPRSKLILGGFSQGAILAIELALNYHEPCAGLLIFSGTLVNEEKWCHQAPLHASTPFFQSHGTQDSLLPVKRAHALEHLLLKSGLKGKLHTFEGGHTINHEVLKELSNFISSNYI